MKPTSPNQSGQMRGPWDIGPQLPAMDYVHRESLHWCPLGCHNDTQTEGNLETSDSHKSHSNSCTSERQKYPGDRGSPGGTHHHRANVSMYHQVPVGKVGASLVLPLRKEQELLPNCQPGETVDIGQ